MLLACPLMHLYMHHGHGHGEGGQNAGSDPGTGRTKDGGGVTMVATLIGVGYTTFSDWLNVDLRQSWTYTAAMPRLPPWGTGLAPFLQWPLLPPLAMLAAQAACASFRALRSRRTWNITAPTQPTATTILSLTGLRRQRAP
ncbi:DUF2933 domain-containing protein [Falsiroseomonas sp. HC035]|uniref:DUF2933 domain-containing protein n=1 Tax=Falsiroseomonas sp. HC035 TaxID=3390999 RepID=UPI003D31E937